MLAINLHQNFHWQQPETADGYTEDEAGIVRNGVINLSLAMNCVLTFQSRRVRFTQRNYSCRTKESEHSRHCLDNSASPQFAEH